MDQRYQPYSLNYNYIIHANCKISSNRAYLHIMKTKTSTDSEYFKLSELILSAHQHLPETSPLTQAP